MATALPIFLEPDGFHEPLGCVVPNTCRATGDARAARFHHTHYVAHECSLHQAGVEAELADIPRGETYLDWQYDAEPQQDSVRARRAT